MPADEMAVALKYDEAGTDAETHRGAVLRRLTHNQYNNTVNDLLGDQTAPANQFPPEDFVNGYKNQYEAQNLSPLLKMHTVRRPRNWRTTFFETATRTS